MTEDPDRTDREAFQRLLDVYGAARERWPAAERLKFAQLLSRDTEARRLLAETVAMDRVLDRGAVIPAQSQAALAARIVAASALVAQDRRASPARSPGTSAVTVPMIRPMAPRLAVRWEAVALLAASLIAGVLIGVSGSVAPAVEGIVSIASSGSSDAELDYLLGDGVAVGEDIL